VTSPEAEVGMTYPKNSRSVTMVIEKMTSIRQNDGNLEMIDESAKPNRVEKSSAVAA
jgi:hypothetical protein